MIIISAVLTSQIISLRLFFSVELQGLDSSGRLLDAASWGFGGATACPTPQRWSSCCRRSQPHCSHHPPTLPLPTGPWPPQTSDPAEPGADLELGGCFGASLLTPAGAQRRSVWWSKRTGGGSPGLQDGRGSGIRSTGSMQGWI